MVIRNYRILILGATCALTLLGLWRGGLSARQNTVSVSRLGSEVLDGSLGSPYYLVEAGVYKAQPGDILSIGAGVYAETITVDKPVTRTAQGGTAIIGSVQGRPHTTFKTLTYNTHLFGGEFLGFLPTFADDTRAAYITAKVQEESADVVVMQEVWDEDLAYAIIDGSGYPYSFYSNEHDEWGDMLNSGLLLLSQYPLLDTDLIFYEDEETCPPWPSGCDGWASKGFIKATIQKAGFQIGVFSTHTDAGEEDADVRRNQIEQLSGEIAKYLSENPGAEVIAMGDFNVTGESSEYFDSLIPTIGMFDAFRNAPCFDTKFRYTVDEGNDLVQMFEENPQNQRLDYVFYTRNGRYALLPMYSEVRSYIVNPPIVEGGNSSEDLSDHYGLITELSLYR